MGFNIGVSANLEYSDIEFECDKFIDRIFYNWIVEFNTYGEKSCIFQTGIFFNLNLKPITNLIYINGDEIDTETISFGMQKTEYLIGILEKLIKGISENVNFINQINYEKNRNVDNLWKNYILKGKLLENLNTLKESLKCFKSKGFENVYLTAG